MEALVMPHPDVADILAHLLAEAGHATKAEACALMALDSNGELSLLAAQSHRAVELEILQIQRETVPCVDVINAGRPVHVSGADAIRQRWDKVGAAIVDAGFQGVE